MSRQASSERLRSPPSVGTPSQPTSSSSDTASSSSGPRPPPPATASSAFSARHRSIPNLSLTGLSAAQSSSHTLPETQPVPPSTVSSDGQITAGTGSGRKTPRRVQFARGLSQGPGTRNEPGLGRYAVDEFPEDALEVQRDGLPLPPSLKEAFEGVETSQSHNSVLSLDEEGLDPEAFAALRAALERHESTSPRQSREQDEPNRTSRLTSVLRNPFPHTEQHHANPVPILINSASAPATPHSESLPSTAHHTPPVGSPHRHLSLSRHRHPQSVPEDAAEPHPTNNDDLPPELQHMNDQPLPPDVPHYVPPGETEGLPAPLDSAPDYQSQARGLVTSHRKGVKSWWRRREKVITGSSTATSGPIDVEKKAGTSHAFGFGFGLGGLGAGMGTSARVADHAATRRGHDEDSDSDSDTAHSHSHHHRHSHSRTLHTPGSLTPTSTIIRGTGGVLSSLLALYNSQNDHANGSGSETTSMDVSRATTPASSTSDLRGLEKREREKKEGHRRGNDGKHHVSSSQKDRVPAAAPVVTPKRARKPIFRLSSDDDPPAAPPVVKEEKKQHNRSLSAPVLDGGIPLATISSHGSADDDDPSPSSHSPIAPIAHSASMSQLVPNAPLGASQRNSTASSSMDNLVRAFKAPVETFINKAPPAVVDALPLPALAASRRPAAARSGGGVFGALIASTGNLAGGAAPAASTIGPTVKRPGYHLSRYSLDESKIREQEREKEAASSRAASRAPSPADSGAAGATTTEPHTHSLDSPQRETPPSRSRKQSGGLKDAFLNINNGMGIAPSRTTTRESSGRTSHNHSPGGLAHLLHMPPSMPWMSNHGSRAGSPAPSEGSWGEKSGYFDGADREKRDGRKSAARRRKEKRKREEIYITMHVAEILQRQEFIMKLARALMMFGAPSHRLEAQLQATAKVLDINVQVINLPNVMLISFGDPSTHTSETKFIKQGANLDLGKLLDAHLLYWRVTHDELGVAEASASLDVLMRQKPIYRGSVTVLIGGLCSAFITPVSFNGSFIDACIAFPLGGLLVFIQSLASKNELYSNVFEITVATVSSFLAAALASTHQFCYSAVASGSVVLILPGYIVLTGSLELASRGIISGAVRMGYSVIYSLFLGFGLAIGGEIYSQITGDTIYNVDDYLCAKTHDPNGPWYQRTASIWWAFLCVPAYSLFLTLRNQAPLFRKEMLVTLLISCAGWAANHFASKRFVNRSDITSAIGSFAVGVLGNLYGRFAAGNAFIVMITGILFQLPSGLSNGGLLAFSSDSQSGSSDTYSTGFQTAEQLVEVAIGLTVGLFVASVVVHPFQSKRRGAGLFSL